MLALALSTSCSKKSKSGNGSSDGSQPSAGQPASPGTPATGAALPNSAAPVAAGANGLSGASTPGAATAPGSGQSVAMVAPGGKTESALVAPAPPPPPNCYTVTYHHKNFPSHNSDEACSHHKNTIRLKHAKYNKESLCVRVNNTPVRFKINKKKADELLLGAVAGPKSVITATYCIQKNTCNQNCKIPKDEFLDAIGGSEEAANGKAVQWDSSDTGAQELDNKVKHELAEFNETQSNDGTTLFKDWLSDEGTPACTTNKQAVGPAGKPSAVNRTGASLKDDG